MGTPGCAMEIESSQGVDYIIHHIKRKKKKTAIFDGDKKKMYSLTAIR
jgi:hypothetical protein